MKKLFEKHFERTWLIIFLIMFFLIMIPFPFFYSETYIPTIGGIPSFLFGWFANTAIMFVLIIVYYRMCMKRKEYHIYDEDQDVTDTQAAETTTTTQKAKKEGTPHGCSH